MDPAERARYQAAACYFSGGYVADAGLLPAGEAAPAQVESGAPDSLGLGLGLGTEQVQAMDLPDAAPAAEPSTADALGLGLGLGSEAVTSGAETEQPEHGATQRLLIKAEC